MLYELNGKIYIRPFVNKIVEVKVAKEDNEIVFTPTDIVLYITPEIKGKMVPVSNEEAYRIFSKSGRKSLNEM